MSRLALFVAALILTACPAPQVDAASCAPLCEELASGAGSDDTETKADSTGASSVQLSSFENELVGSIIQDVRQGVRPFDDQSLGICPRGENARQCDEMLGMDPGELPEGEYMLYGSFRAPSVGERGTWKVKVETTCTTTRIGADGSESSTTAEWVREFDILYTGPDRGYTLSPIRRITSPNSGGAQTCTFMVHTLHPDNTQTHSGAWKVPAAAD